MRNGAEIDDVVLQQESARPHTQIAPEFMGAIARLAGYSGATSSLYPVLLS